MGPLPTASAAGGPDVIEPGEGELIVNLEGFEGPLDLLLSLARDQKVDLRRISMVALVDQYLAHVAQARRIRLELAADYLVMAAWLAYLKSRAVAAGTAGRRRTVGPGDGRRAAVAVAPPRGDAGSRPAPDGAAAAGPGYLLARPARGRHRRPPRRVGREALRPAAAPTAVRCGRRMPTPTRSRRCEFFSVEEAAERLGRMLGIAIDWQTLEAFLPAGLTDPDEPPLGDRVDLRRGPAVGQGRPDRTATDRALRPYSFA